MTESMDLQTSIHQDLSNNLSQHEVARYSRHLIMPEVGMKGQLKLKNSKVLIIGTGGLGSPIAMYLAAAGVGTLGLVDFDEVDFSNLQRQIIHSTNDVGRKKLQSAKEKLVGINPEIKVELHDTALNSTNALEIMEKYDVICDATDNFPTRYLTNDASVMLDKPYVYGSIFRFEGQVTVFNHEDGPCYRCLYENPPPPGLVPSCAEGGVLGILPGIIGTIQANEIVKLILGIGKPLSGRLLLFDALDMEFKELKVRKKPDCVMCSEDPEITELIDYEEFCGIGTDEVPLFSEQNSISVDEMEELRQQGYDFQLIDVREPHEQDISKIPGATLIPLNKIDDNFDKIDNEKLTIVYCKTGVRSGKAVVKLKQEGFSKVKNLIGGVNKYAEKIDPTQPKY